MSSLSPWRLQVKEPCREGAGTLSSKVQRKSHPFRLGSRNEWRETGNCNVPQKKKKTQHILFCLRVLSIVYIYKRNSTGTWIVGEKKKIHSTGGLELFLLWGDKSLCYPKALLRGLTRRWLSWHCTVMRWRCQMLEGNALLTDRWTSHKSPKLSTHIFFRSAVNVWKPKLLQSVRCIYYTSMLDSMQSS